MERAQWRLTVGFQLEALRPAAPALEFDSASVCRTQMHRYYAQSYRQKVHSTTSTHRRHRRADSLSRIRRRNTLSSSPMSPSASSEAGAGSTNAVDGFFRFDLLDEELDDLVLDFVVDLLVIAAVIVPAVGVDGSCEESIKGAVLDLTELFIGRVAVTEGGGGGGVTLASV